MHDMKDTYICTINGVAFLINRCSSDLQLLCTASLTVESLLTTYKVAELGKLLVIDVIRTFDEYCGNQD